MKKVIRWMGQFFPFHMAHFIVCNNGLSWISTGKILFLFFSILIALFPFLPSILLLGIGLVILLNFTLSIMHSLIFLVWNHLVVALTSCRCKYDITLVFKGLGTPMSRSSFSHQASQENSCPAWGSASLLLGQMWPTSRPQPRGMGMTLLSMARRCGSPMPSKQTGYVFLPTLPKAKHMPTSLSFVCLWKHQVKHMVL